LDKFKTGTQVIFAVTRYFSNIITSSDFELTMSIGTLLGTKTEDKGGLFFVKLNLNKNEEFSIEFDEKEQYFMGKSVMGVEYASKDILVAVLFTESSYHVIDRS
jgi:hypothetical protein